LSFNLLLDKSECIRLYADLKWRESELDVTLQGLLRRLEGVLFEHLSIEDVETLCGGEASKRGGRE